MYIHICKFVYFFLVYLILSHLILYYIILSYLDIYRAPLTVYTIQRPLQRGSPWDKISVLREREDVVEKPDVNFGSQ